MVDVLINVDNSQMTTIVVLGPNELMKFQDRGEMSRSFF